MKRIDPSLRRNLEHFCDDVRKCFHVCIRIENWDVF